MINCITILFCYHIIVLNAYHITINLLALLYYDLAFGSNLLAQSSLGQDGPALGGLGVTRG